MMWKLFTGSMIACCCLASPALGSNLVEEILGVKLLGRQQREDPKQATGFLIKREVVHVQPLFDFGLGLFPVPDKGQPAAAVMVRATRAPQTYERIIGDNLTQELARFTDKTEELLLQLITGATGQHSYYASASSPDQPPVAGQPKLAQPAGSNLEHSSTLRSARLPPVPKTDPTAFLLGATKQR
jgi:hypothetical protein